MFDLKVGDRVIRETQLTRKGLLFLPFFRPQSGGRTLRRKTFRQSLFVERLEVERTFR